MRKLGHAAVSTLLLGLGACHHDVGTDPGGGTQTLTVNGHVELEGGGAQVHVSVRRAGAEVQGAIVTVDSKFGALALTYVGGADYETVQAGWAPGYRITVESGEDWLDGSIEAPDLPVLLAPSALTPFDPHLAEGGVVNLEWDGARAMSIKVETKNFDVTVADVNKIAVPATAFEEDQQEIKLERENTTPLAGGTPGSSLDARCETKTRVSVLNPF